MTDDRLAVIDIGSNSGRVVVMRLGDAGHLEILADARIPLRLVSETDSAGRLSAAALDRTALAVLDFLSVASSAEASRVHVVATAAVREATNGADFVHRLSERTGVAVDVLDGEAEARYAFVGAVHGLPVNDGLMVDVGGGSMEVSSFRGRRMVRSWTLPLGALRLTEHFLSADPPKGSETARLRDHVGESLAAAGVPALHAGEALVGTGGTIRNLAKVDRTAHTYPIPRMHGYVLTDRGLHAVGERLLGVALSRRAGVRGLSADRADSIVGGLVAVQAFVDRVGADELLVSGQGLREGVALAGLRDLPATGTVRATSVLGLARRFSTWDERRAERRQKLTARLLDLLVADATPDVRELCDYAATLLDIGRSIDYYSRWDHAASIVRAGDLRGFSHRAIAMLVALVERAGSDRADGRSYAALLTRDERRQLAPAATVLALADEIERRVPAGRPLDVTRRDRKKLTTITAPILHPWSDPDIVKRFRREFGSSLAVEPASAP